MKVRTKFYVLYTMGIISFLGMFGYVENYPFVSLMFICLLGIVIFSIKDMLDNHKEDLPKWFTDVDEGKTFDEIDNEKK